MGSVETILIIDDDSQVREVLKSYLEGLDYAILEAGGGPEGLQVSLAETPHLILLDITMSPMDGFEVCRRLKAEPATAEIPVMFLSGLPGIREKVEAFQAGGVDYVTKPFQMIEVATRVKTHLMLREKNRQLERASEELREALAGARLLNRKLIDMNERLRQSEELQSQFISNMRNEINNPLNVLMGLADELGSASLEPARRSLLSGMVKAEAFYLDFHLRNVFCAGELEAGEALPAVARVDVASVLGEVAASFRPFADSKAVVLEVTFEPGEEGPTFPTDAGMLSLIAGNLVANAVEFSHSGGTVAIRAQADAETLTLAVEDHGIGIAEVDREAIFARFHQLSTGPSRAHHGQGLGLSLVKALVELQGGSIQVDGGPGLGSTFTMVLPRGALAPGVSADAFDGNLFIFGDPEEK